MSEVNSNFIIRMPACKKFQKFFNCLVFIAKQNKVFNGFGLFAVVNFDFPDTKSILMDSHGQT